VAFVDFSDPDDMFDLLNEYVTDELAEAEDSGRRRFLSGLLNSLADLQEQFAGLTADQQIASLRSLHRSIDTEFESDAVAQHLEDCAAELERVREKRSG
jgi:hypothetical protein